jgi:hypothetical protein
MILKKSVRSLALVSAAALAAGMSIGGASAAPGSGGTPEILANNIPTPLSVAVAGDGTAYVTGNFAGLLFKVPDGGAPEVIHKATEKGAEIGGVSVLGARVVFAQTGSTQKVWQINGGADAEPLANVGRYEKKNNPDKIRTYGFLGLSDACKNRLPKGQHLKPYQGIVESHPYATEQVGNTVYLADAAGNDILSITKSGVVDTVAVLPRTKVNVTKARAEAFGLPGCVVGHKFALESVPTDVEMGADGWLYVSSLPGGPEDGTLGAQGRVYRINPATGRVVKVAGGLVSAVNVAVAEDGDVYVSQLFAGSIVRIPAGTNKKIPFAQVPMPAGLEYTTDGLYATIDALKGNKTPKGKLAFIEFVGTP